MQRVEGYRARRRRKEERFAAGLEMNTGRNARGAAALAGVGPQLDDRELELSAFTLIIRVRSGSAFIVVFSVLLFLMASIPTELRLPGFVVAGAAKPGI